MWLRTCVLRHFGIDTANELQLSVGADAHSVSKALHGRHVCVCGRSRQEPTQKLIREVRTYRTCHRAMWRQAWRLHGCNSEASELQPRRRA